MRFAGWWREVARNVTSGTSRVVALAALLALVGGGLAVADVTEVRGLLDEATEFRASGAATVTLLAPGRIDGRACAALAEVDGVDAAGALREAPALKAITLPGTPISVYEVTPGFPSVVSDENPGPIGIVVAADVAETLALEVGDALATSQGETTIAGTYASPTDGRRAGFGWAAMLPTSEPGAFDECWVSAWPQLPDMRSLVNTTLLSAGATSDESPPQLTQLNTTLGREFTGPERFAERAGAFAPLVAAFVAALLSVGAVRVRRLEVASKLHAGAKRSDVVTMMCAEAVAWLLPAVVVTVAVAVFTATAVGPPDRPALWLEGVRIAVAISIAVLGGTAIATALIRERHLFRFFKDRR